MAVLVSDQELAKNLPKLLEVAGGSEVIVTSGGLPVAKLARFATPAGARRPGAMPELQSLPDEFYQPLSDDELAAWER